MKASSKKGLLLGLGLLGAVLLTPAISKAQGFGVTVYGSRGGFSFYRGNAYNYGYASPYRSYSYGSVYGSRSYSPRRSYYYQPSVYGYRGPSVYYQGNRYSNNRGNRHHGHHHHHHHGRYGR